MPRHSPMRRWWLAGICAVLVVAAVLAVPLGRAAARNVAALQTKPIVQTIDWTDPAVMCTPAVPPPVIAVPACDAGDACYLNSILALRRGEWAAARAKSGSSSYVLDVLVRGWAAWCGQSQTAAIAEWQRAAGAIGNKFYQDARFALQEQNAARALQAGALAQQLAPSGKTHLVLGRAYEGLGDPVKALEEYRSALAIEQGDAELYWHMSDLAWKQDRVAEARTYVEQALDLDATNPLYWHRLGQILLKGNDGVGSERAFMREAELDPKYSGAYVGIFLARMTQGRVQDALEPLLRLVALSTDRVQNAGHLGTYAVALRARGDYAGAAEYFGRAVQENPTHEVFWSNYLHALATLGACDRLATAYAEHVKVFTERSMTPVAQPACPQK